MNIHKNARLTPVRREEMALAVISGRLSKAQAARVYGLSARSVSRWTERYRAEDPSGMQDRSSRPQVIPTQTAEAASGVHHHAGAGSRLCGRHIAELTGVSPATVSRVLRRAGLSRLKDLIPAQPVLRYADKEPGGLIHLDIKNGAIGRHWSEPNGDGAI